jgi:peroxiredoxin
MSNHSTKKTALTLAVTALAAAGLGYLLVTSSPQNGASSGSASMGAPNTAQLDALVGKPLPSLQIADKDGKAYNLADFKGKYTVLFFNEGLMCYPACWNQVAAFGQDSRFNTDQVQAISVVADSAREWQKAIDQMPDLAKAKTLFDTGAAASRQLGMLDTASSMHRDLLPGHTYVLLDKEGIVRYVFDDPNMAIGNDRMFSKIQELSN